MAFSEKPSSISILRRSIFTFFQHYQFFSTFSAFIAFPVAAAVLLSPPLLLNSPLHLLIRRRLSLLFQAAAFPPSSAVFSLLNLKLSQTITSSFILIPLSISFNAICKTSVIHFINYSRRKLSLSNFRSIYIPIVQTQIWVFFIILSANSVCYFIFFFAFNFNFMDSTILVSVFGCVIYSVVLANVVVICNLAIVLSGMEKIGGYDSILKGCVLIRRKMGIGLLIALPTTIAMAGFEALFQYRVVRVYNGGNDLIPTFCLVSEGVLIAYLYSIVIVLDFLVSCLFFKGCSRDSCFDDRIQDEESASGYMNLYYV